MQQTESAVLLQNLVSLTEGFSHLGMRLSQAASALQAAGMPPAKNLLDELAASRQSFADLCSKGLALAESLAISPLPKAEALASLSDLKSLLQVVVQAEEKSKAARSLSQRALAILDRVRTLNHRERGAFPPLTECQARATSLRNAIAEVPWPKLHPSAETIGRDDDPFWALLALVEHGEELDDEQCMMLQEIIEHSFGKPLAIAALRGRLTLPPETNTSSDETLIDEGITSAIEGQNNITVANPDPPPAAIQFQHNTETAEEKRTRSSSPVFIPEQEEENSKSPEAGLSVSQELSPAVVAEQEPDVTPGEAEVFYHFSPEEKAQKIAGFLLNGSNGVVKDKPTILHDLVWRLVFEEKISIAFHVARCLETQYPDFRPHLPSWLLRAVVLGQRVRNPNGEIARLLKDDFARCGSDCAATGNKEWDLAIEFLLIAASLIPTLLAPEARSSMILHSLDLGDGLEQLSSYCGVIAGYGDLLVPLDPAFFKKQGRTQSREAVGFVRRLMGSQDAAGRKDSVQEQIESLRLEVASRHEIVLEELNLFRDLNSSIPLLGSVNCCRRALENVITLCDAEVPFVSDEPLPRPLLNADLSRIPSLVLNKQGDVEGADQPAFVESVLRLIASGALKMI